MATYIGCMTGEAVTRKILEEAVKKAGLWGVDQQLSFPLITKQGINQHAKTVHYYFNYSASPKSINYPHRNGKELFSGETILKNKPIELGVWGVKIVEED